VQVHVRDFLIKAADLVLSEQAVPPQDGDRIKLTLGETTYVFEVMPLGDEPAARWSDRYGYTWRIHTKEIGTE
ncbi:hypothetical protein LCGC14_2556640, partial [marine sediment metagenome]